MCIYQFANYTIVSKCVRYQLFYCIANLVSVTSLNCYFKIAIKLFSQNKIELRVQSVCYQLINHFGCTLITTFTSKRSEVTEQNASSYHLVVKW
jgi:hypothetical protein